MIWISSSIEWQSDHSIQVVSKIDNLRNASFTLSTALVNVGFSLCELISIMLLTSLPASSKAEGGGGKFLIIDASTFPLSLSEEFLWLRILASSGNEALVVSSENSLLFDLKWGDVRGEKDPNSSLFWVRWELSNLLIGSRALEIFIDGLVILGDILLMSKKTLDFSDEVFWWRLKTSAFNS